jgi:hypothetical protein
VGTDRSGQLRKSLPRSRKERVEQSRVLSSEIPELAQKNEKRHILVDKEGLHYDVAG